MKIAYPNGHNIAIYGVPVIASKSHVRLLVVQRTYCSQSPNLQELRELCHDQDIKYTRMK